MPFHGRDQRQYWHDRWQAGYWPDDQALEKLALRSEFRMPASARVALPVILSLLIQVPPSVYWFVQLRTPLSAVTVVVALLGPLALLLVRRFPGPVVVFVSAAACADFVVADERFGPPYLALAFAIILSIVHGARIWAWISVGAFWIGTIAVGILLGVVWHPAQIAISTLGILVTFGIAEAIRTRRENFERYRGVLRQRRQTEVQAERVRIARELHDVLAHSLSQINVQASVGLHLMDKQPGKAAEALSSIKETSKTALDEVRSVLGVLRAEGGQDPSAPLVPEPDLSRLAGLAASVTSQGVDVTLTNAVAEAPKAVQLAIYRIVQESLTNVVRHARATAATVDVATTGRQYVVTVGDNGAGIEGLEPDTGRGLLGMRERAELLGGTLETGKSPAGGLLVTVRIPERERNE